MYPFGEPGTHYRRNYPDMVLKLLMLKPGLLDTDIADFFSIPVSTLDTWKRENPEFKEAIFQGKEGSDMQVVSALFRKATGFTEEVTKIDNKGGVHYVNEYFPPDTKAINIWLNNRRPDNWKANRSQQNQGTHTVKRVTNVIFTKGTKPGEEASQAVKAIEATQDSEDDNDIIDIDETD